MNLQDILEHNRRVPVPGYASHNLRGEKSANSGSCQEGYAHSPVGSNPARPIPLESDLHDNIFDWIRARGWLAIHSRMDQRTATAKGVSDFILVTPKTVVFCECKRPGKKATPEQLAFLAHANRLGWPNGIVHNMKEFSDLMDRAQQCG